MMTKSNNNLIMMIKLMRWYDMTNVISWQTSINISRLYHIEAKTTITPMGSKHTMQKKEIGIPECRAGQLTKIFLKSKF